MLENGAIKKAIVDLPILKGKKFIPNALKIFIEISGRCNAKCPYCARHHFKQRFSGENMSSVLFEQILDHLFSIGVLHINHNLPIFLYNWGEPFLNPEINGILEILKKKKLHAAVSSNFIVTPEIDKDNLPVIREVIFSLSGFNQDSYGKIHGVSLNKVLNKFETFYIKIRNHSPNTNIDIAWHRYKFNEREFWTAYKYFNRPGIRFNPTVAVLGEFFEMLSYYTNGRLSENRKKQAEKDLYLTHVSQELAYHKKRSENHHCCQWKNIVIDETGKLLLCCGMTNKNLEHILGGVL